MSAMMKNRRGSRNAKRNSLDEAEMKAGVQSLTKLESVSDAILAASGALQTKVKYAFQVLDVATREYR